MIRGRIPPLAAAAIAVAATEPPPRERDRQIPRERGIDKRKAKRRAQKLARRRNRNK